jgi:hypothetical protein
MNTSWMCLLARACSGRGGSRLDEADWFVDENIVVAKFENVALWSMKTWKRHP